MMIWSAESYNKTAEQAVQEFAKRFWSEPRKATKLNKDCTFQIKGGIATYRVVERKLAGIRCWIVERL